MHFSIAQANLPKMYLEYSPISFHVDFFLPMWPLLSKLLYISMRRRKKVLFSAQSNQKSVNLGTLPVFDFCHQTPCEKHTYLFVWKHEKNYTEKLWTSEEIVWKCEACLKKNEKNIWKNMNLTEQVKEFIWQKYGKMKNLYGNVKDF